MDAFDADVLIYAAAPDHVLGRLVARLFADAARISRDVAAGDEADPAAERETAGVGSLLLLPELLAKPMRDGRDDEVGALAALLARLDLRPVDEATAALATVLAARHRLKPMDAVHLATAIAAGADRFVTNNRRDFDSTTVTKIAVAYPEDLQRTAGGDLPSH